MDEKYFNIPIQLIAGLMTNKNATLRDICLCAIYEHSTKLEANQLDSYDTPKNRIEKSCKWYGVVNTDIQEIAIRGKRILASIPDKSPKVGISMTLFWEYFKEEKNHFELACLLAYLALKSIVQNKAYCKTDNVFLLSRMDGKPNKVKDFGELSPEIRTFANEYQTRKIKRALQKNWGLIYYSRYTRGFYVSFGLTLDQLAFEAEKRRLSVWEKQNKYETQEATKRALSKLLW